jgi:hypothetical protein
MVKEQANPNSAEWLFDEDLWYFSANGPQKGLDKGVILGANARLGTFWR